MWACESGSLEMMKMLIEHGADVNQAHYKPKGHTHPNNGETPLHMACFQDRADVAELLLEKGAEIDRHTVERPSVTPSSLVLDKEREKCSGLLVFEYHAMTPHNAMRLMVPTESAALLLRLLEIDTDPNQNFGLGQGSLDVALRLGDGQLIEHCLRKSAVSKLLWPLTSPEVTRHQQQPWYPQLTSVLSQQPPPIFTSPPAQPTVVTRDTPEKELYIDLTLPTDLSHPRKIIFTTISHAQGWSHYPHDHGSHQGSETFFVADIHARDQDGNLKPTAEPRRIVYNVHASAESKEHTVVWDADDGSDEQRR